MTTGIDDHARDEGGEQADVPVGNRDVEHLAQQERRDDADRRREDDQRADGREARAVRPEQRDDPPQVRLADGRVGRTLGRLVGGEGIEASTGHVH